MKVLCVQCMKLNDLPDGAEGKVKLACPNCGFVTVVTRKAAKNRAPAPAKDAGDDRPTTSDGQPVYKPPRQSDLPTGKPHRAVGTAGTVPANDPRRKSLHDELFDGSEKAVGDWMVRRLDGTEAGPLTFDALKEMIREGDIGKIDEVRRLEERYVPAAFHEQTAELFNELDMAGVAPPKGR